MSKLISALLDVGLRDFKPEAISWITLQNVPKFATSQSEAVLLSWYLRYQVTDLIWPNLGTVTCLFDLAMAASRQHTNHGSTKLAWYTAEVNLKGTITWV